MDWQIFSANVKKAFRQYSTYVHAFMLGAAAYWMQLSPDEQKAILDAVPMLKLVGPGLGFVAFMLAKGIPQTHPDPKE